MAEVKTRIFPKRGKLFSGLTDDILSTVLWSLLSFCTARAVFLGEASVFGTAAVGASKRTASVGAALGAILGYISLGDPEEKLRQIASVLVIFASKLLLERFANGEVLTVLITGASVAFVSFGYAAGTLLSGYNAGYALAETLLAAGSAYFFKRSETAFEHRKPVMTLSSGDKACVLVTLSIAAASLVNITFGKISLGAVIAAVLVLISANYGGVSSGAVAGISSGTVLGIAAGNLSTTVPAFGIGGLVCGIFAVFGKWGTALSFVTVQLIAAILSTDHYPDYTGFYEAVAASVLILLLPKKLGKFISNVSAYDENKLSSATVKELILSKMGRAADGLIDLSTATAKVSESLEKASTLDLSTVLNNAAKTYCRECPKSFECWQAKKDSTTKVFCEMAESVKRNKTPDFPADFSEICPRKDALFNDIKVKYKEASFKNSQERKIKNIRSVLTDQFSATALLLKDIAADTAVVKAVDKKLSLGVKNIFDGHNIPLFASTCYYTAEGLVNIEVSGAKERLKNADMVDITEEISDLCGCDMGKPVKRDTENARRLFFCEKPLIEADFGTASINAEGEKFCGDSCEHFVDQYGCAHLILSDGMGSGEHAALDAMMTGGLVARLVRAGFRFGSAIKLVNSALLLKSEDESLATVDALSVNLYTGCADFYKAGAECSFVLKNGRVSKVESQTLPIGILGGTEYEQNSMRLSCGDIAVLLTDGVTFTGSDWIPSELKSLAEKPADDIAKGIAETAHKRRTDGHSDDITVAVIKLNSAY